MAAFHFWKCHCRWRYGRPVSDGGVRLELRDGVAILLIDRPAARNAIGLSTIGELEAALDEVASSDARAVVITGGGDRAFVSGGDLKELNAIRSHEAAVDMAVRMRRVLDRVATYPVPVIAALNGHALGGGAEVAIAADIRIAADDVTIGFNQVRLGIMPAWGGAERLAQTIGRSRALLAVTTGDRYDAATAYEWGLVDVVVPRSSFAESWWELARRIADTAPGATRSLKEVVDAAVSHIRPELEATATDTFARLWVAEAHWAAVEAMTRDRGSPS